MSGADFERLAASQEFAKFSAILARLAGVPMSLHSPEGEIRQMPSCGMNNPVCKALRSSSRGLALCSACDRKKHRQAADQGKALLYRCHAGFLDMTIPIFAQGRHIASISSGQILPEPPSEESLRKIAKRFPWLGVDDGKSLKAWLKAPSMPREKASLVMSLLETFAGQLCESLRRIQELENKLEREELRKAKDYIAKRFRDPELSLAEVARHAGLSPAHFSHLFKKTLGEAFARHVQRLRVEAAKRLLTQTEKSISEICFACGFNSLAHFIRVFRAFERMPPTRFRETALGKTD